MNQLVDSLTTLGWAAGAPLFVSGDERPGRVSVVHGPSIEVIWFPSDAAAETTLFELRRDLNLRPVAGDWIVIDGGEPVRVVPRRTSLSRPDPNERDIQVLAANIDTVMIVLPIDRGLNLKNLERLSVMVWDSGADPLVVLTKADATDDPEPVVEEAQAAAPGVPVVLTSAVDGRGLDELRSRMAAGTTTTMLGASGVGKTSLLNALEGHAEAVREVRRDGQGRHTTTTRKLYRLGSGGVLLDLPGIRSLDLYASDAAVEETFADVAALAEYCQFRDCAHDGDKGCAVEAAVAAGELPERRLQSWHAIRREMAYQSRRSDPAAMAAQRQEWKRVTKASKKDSR
ncbi:ribosome small subunit-dependent GTPase A [Paractinoplanes maris]|uniref:ribosome small subunit-dependent GTPase A n=1 Tax=Paractinoplanes maris TaxID=1734446 RepID=UPI002020B69E|nr:ribosome small subunit-dependent GTPase A [Actinoplanes maris]